MKKIYRDEARVYVDKNNIVHLEEKSEMTESSIEDVIKANLEIMSRPNPPQKLLVDLRGVNIQKAVALRKKTAELTKVAKVSNIQKAAILTDNRLLWIVASFMTAYAGIKNPNYAKPFFSEEEAMSWLQK